MFPLLLIACAGFVAGLPRLALADDAAHSHEVGEAEDASHDAGEGDAASHDDAHHVHVGEDVSATTKDLVKDIRPDLAIFTLIVFLLLFGGLYVLAWPKITAALDQRAAHIQQGFTDAEKARQQAMTLLKEHQGKMEAIQDEVKEIIAEARRDAERTKADIVASAAKESEVIKDRALLEIGRAKDQALNELFQQMAEQVAGATQHVLGKGITLADQQKLIDEALREFASQSA